MKFLYYSFYIPPLLKDTNVIVGGAAVQWKSWIKGFRDNGHEFGLLTWEGAEKYIGKKLDFDIVESYDPNYGVKILRFIFYRLPKLYNAIKKYDPDFVIQGGATQNTFVLMLISKILRIPFVHRIANDSDVDERIFSMVHKREIFLYKLGVKYSDFIFAQNSYQINQLKEKYPKKHIYILHNPYEVETRETDLLPRSKRNYIAWVGNFRYMKNLPALVNIAAQSQNIKIKIAGMEHNNIDEGTKKAIDQLKKLNNVQFVGYLKRTELTPFLLKAIALLNTSRHEGFSNTFLEAWSCGTPIISTNNANPDGLITKYNLGKSADNYEQQIQYLKEIIDCDDQIFDKLALHCYKYVKENHDPKILAEKFVSYLKLNK